MKNSKFTVILLLLVVSCVSPEIRRITISNTSNQHLRQVVSIPLEGDLANTNQVFEGKETIPSDFIDKDGDGNSESVLVLIDLPAGETTTLALEKVAEPEYNKMTQAELSIKTGGEWGEIEYEGGGFENVTFLRVPEQHTDHTYFIRYEGPGWESDQMAYRFYLDWRNGVDVFGKLTPEMVLQDVGLDGFDSYHELSDWGMDLLKVGSTLGGGSIGRFINDTLYRFKDVDSVTCEIVRDGYLTSAIKTTYYNWSDGGSSTDLISSIGIEAGSALTEHQLSFGTSIKGFCTGLVENEGEQYLNEVMGDYRVLATYGDYSLNNDQMGLALLVPKSSIKEVVDGAGSHVVLFEPSEKVSYYFIAVWEKGTNPVQSMTEFKELLQLEVANLSFPLQYDFK